MQRTPEPELMEDLAQVQAYAAADFSAGDGAVVERLAALASASGADLDTSPGALVVDLGCGPGNISLRLLERFRSARVVGIDGSATMLQLAEQRRRSLSPAAADRLRFEQHTLPSPGLADPTLAGRCQAVVSNSLLHHLHRPEVLWEAAVQLAAPGALIYLRDLRRPQDATSAEALLERHLPQAAAVLRRDYLASLHAAFTPEEVAAQLSAAGLGCLQVEALADRYLEVWGRLA